MTTHHCESILNRFLQKIYVPKEIDTVLYFHLIVISKKNK